MVKTTEKSRSIQASSEREKALDGMARAALARRDYGALPATEWWYDRDHALTYARVWTAFSDCYRAAYGLKYPTALDADWPVAHDLVRAWGSALAPTLVRRAFKEPALVAYGIPSLVTVLGYGARLAGPLVRGSRLESTRNVELARGARERRKAAL